MNDAWLEVSVARRWQEAVDIVGLELVAPSAAALPAFEPGAHIDVLTPGAQLRSYSLANDPVESHRYVIAVLREAHGRGGSMALCDQVGAGARLRVRPPSNDFALRPHAVHSVLLAGGIGIAPLRSMAAQLWRRGAPFELHYSARTAARAAFSGDLARCAYRSRVHLRYSEAQGRLDIAGLLQRAPASADVYACGPPAFVAGVAEALSAARRPPERLHVESFKL